MRKKIPYYWEETDVNGYTYRCKVIGGRLVLKDSENSQCMCFVKDIDHEWVVQLPEKEDKK